MYNNWFQSLFSYGTPWTTPNKTPQLNSPNNCLGYRPQLGTPNKTPILENDLPQRGTPLRKVIFKCGGLIRGT